MKYFIIVSFTSLLISGCGAVIHEKDNILINKYPECKGTFDFTNAAKADFFGIQDKKALKCAKEKERLAESEHQMIKEKKQIAYSLDKKECTIIGQDFAQKKGALLNDSSPYGLSNESHISCSTLLSIGFETRLYRIDLNRTTREYIFTQIPIIN